jgi:NitT/TauT family transport system substrate-binding protein
MNKHKKFLASGLIIFTIAVATAFFFKQPFAASPTVHIGYLNITASLPLFIAEENGYLKEEGLKYEALPTATSNQLVDGILARNLDAFIESSAVPVLSAELQSPGRLKIFSVSSITKNAPFDALLVKDESQIKTLSDLADKKIGVFPGSTATALLKKYLEDNHIDVSGITFIPIPPQNHLTALLKGSVDAIHSYEPTTAIALSKGGVRQLYGSVYADMLEPNPQGVAVISTRFVKQHPREAKKVIRSLERAMVFMREHDSESREILAKRMNLDTAVATRSVFLYMLPHKEIDHVIVQRYADMLTHLGEIKGQIKMDSLIYRD